MKYLFFALLFSSHLFSQNLINKKYSSYKNESKRIEFHRLREKHKMNPKKYKDEFNSLNIKTRKHHIKNLMGLWKYVDFYCGCCVYNEKKNVIQIDKYIRITKDSINFFEKNKTNKTEVITKKEAFKFVVKPNVFLEFTDLIFSDNKIWRFELTENLQDLKVYNAGSIRDGETWVLTSGIVNEFYKKVKR